MSSFNWDSQVSSSVSISKASRSFCSGVSFSSHFALSNFANVVEVTTGAVAVLDAPNTGATAFVEPTALKVVSFPAVKGEDEGGELEAGFAAAPAGEEKNDVMDAFAFGFLVALVATSAALRFKGVAILATGIKLRYGEGKSKSTSSGLSKIHRVAHGSLSDNASRSRRV